MTFGRWLLGVALLAAILIPLALAARAARRRLVPELDGATAALADAILTISGLVVLSQALGVVGLLRPIPLVVAAIAVGVAARAAAPQRRDGEREGSAPGPRVLDRLALAAAALVFAAWLRRTLVSLDFGVGGVDSTWYHLTFAAEFAEGSVAGIPYTDVDFLTSFYPANVELLHAIGMVAFGTAALSPLLSLAALGLTFLAGWCVGRPFGAAPLTLLATTAAVGVPTLLASQAGEAKNDIASLAFLLAAAAFLLAPRTRTAHLVLAGAATGLAVGTKLNLLAPAGGLFVATLVLHRRGALAFAGAALATGGYWFARNLVATGNPLPWLGPLPQPDEPRSEDTLRPLSDYLFDADAWDERFLPGLEQALSAAWPVLAAAALLGAALALIRGERMVRALGAVALLTVVAYVVTPATAAGPEGDPRGFTLNVRYVIPALLFGLCLLAIAARRAATLVAAGFTVLVVVTQLAADEVWESEYLRPAVVLTAGAAAAAIAARSLRRPALVAAIAAAVLVLGLWPLERDFHRRQYTAALQPYTAWSLFDLQPVYAWARANRGLDIAVTGSTGAFFQFPLRGPDLDNDAGVIGRHGDHGSFTQITDCTELRAALEGHTHAVVTPYVDIWEPYRPQPAPELACLRMTGAREVLTSGRIHVFALR